VRPSASTRANGKAVASALRERMRGLAPDQAALMRRVMQFDAQGDKLMANQWLLQLAREAPAHPEVQLWLGMRCYEAQDWTAAAAHFEPVVAARPEGFTARALLGAALARAGDGAGAQRNLALAATLARSAEDWLKLSLECDEQGYYTLAMQAVQGHLKRAPQSTIGLLQRSRVAKALGQTALAADDARALIASGREPGKAWFSLLDLKTVALDEAERQQLARTAADPHLPAEDRLLLDFALGKALEDAGDFDGALAALQRANASVRQRTRWDAAAFARQMQAIRTAFTPPAAGAAVEQGREVIFLVGLPRSGSTLVEQVLAAHPAVEGASELPYLGRVLQAESQRRGCAFPAWVPAATPEDWTRLGQDYLRASAPWRLKRPIATDKLPDNWQFIGAIRAMLPGARIIDCRRDALETCWSCFKQLFGPGLAAYSYGFDSLAQYAAACEAEADHWATLAQSHVRVQHYESLVAEPEAQVRELLAFCGLPFDPACLSPHTAERAIRTPSALQVRQPMRRVSAPAAPYGALLDPLRDALTTARLVQKQTSKG
jgi:tetratricopeptide (TPR) repeat protein